MSPVSPRPRTLPLIVFAQFAGTSLWFAGNAVLPDMQAQWGLPGNAVSAVTSAVQGGFIVGTLVFALTMAADRFSPRALFLICALCGAAANLTILAAPGSLGTLLACRFAVGFFLAGIYPVGMKIAASWYPQAMGSAIGYLVGALVLGTAFPHLLRAFGAHLSWRGVLTGVSLLAASGGVALFALVGDSPHFPRAGRFSPTALAAMFRHRRFRAAALGYFGHMWELYAFWAFVPMLLAARLQVPPNATTVSAWSFGVIAVGAVGCVGAAHWSRKAGSARPAVAALAVSGLCCLGAPLLYRLPTPLFLAGLLVWGMAVIADSAQFSALAARYAPPTQVGSALTLTTCIGFSLTIAAIESLGAAAPHLSAATLFLLLLPGPLLGLAAARPLLGPDT